MTNKIKYGLSNVHYAVATIAADGTATYATPVAIPGAVNLSLTPQGDNVKFYADDVEYWVANGNNGYQGDLEIALVPDTLCQDVLNEIVDSKNVLVEDANSAVVHFALLFQFKGDQEATKHVLYNCTCSRPDVASATKGESIDVQTEKLTITASTIYNSSLQKNITKARTKANTDATSYAGWYSAVYVPTAAAATT